MKRRIFTLILTVATLTAFAKKDKKADVKSDAEVVKTEEVQSARQMKNDAKNAATAEEYRRSSLCLVMAEDPEVKMTEVIKEGFLTSPMPDKYNDHNVGNRTFKFATITLSESDMTLFEESVKRGKQSEVDAQSAAENIEEIDLNAKEESGKKSKVKKKKSGGGFGAMAGGLMRAAGSDATGGVVGAQSKDVAAATAYKYLCDEKFAMQMAKKWFGADAGKHSMTLVQERGLYDASAADLDLASQTQRGKSLLMDAGEELIGNSFVVVSEYNYLSKDELVAMIDEAAQAVAAQVSNQYAAMAAKAATMAIKASLGAGYYVQTSSHLFQLEWNDEVANTFYSEMWSDVNSWESHSDLFKFNYIGTERAWANVKAGIFTKKSETELVAGATINAMDAVLAKLSKKYEVFKTKTPLLVEENEKGESIITAKIGIKEGISSGDKFEVLEASEDPETKKTVYKRVGVIKVSKDQIWDNRFMADEERELTGTAQSFTSTRFDGGKTKYYSGLLIKQMK